MSSHSSGGQRFKIKVSAEALSPLKILGRDLLPASIPASGSSWVKANWFQSLQCVLSVYVPVCLDGRSYKTRVDRTASCARTFRAIFWAPEIKIGNWFLVTRYKKGKILLSGNQRSWREDNFCRQDITRGKSRDLADGYMKNLQDNWQEIIAWAEVTSR